MDIAERLDKWIDCEMRAVEAGNAVKLKDTYSNGKSCQMWSTRNDSFMYKGSGHTEVAFTQSNLPPAWSLKVRDFNQQQDDWWCLRWQKPTYHTYLAPWQDNILEAQKTKKGDHCLLNLHLLKKRTKQGKHLSLLLSGHQELHFFNEPDHVGSWYQHSAF